jgi:hypothetical protein
VKAVVGEPDRLDPRLGRGHIGQEIQQAAAVISQIRGGCTDSTGGAGSTAGMTSVGARSGRSSSPETCCPSP